jgi:hypothetical protein
VGLGQYIASRTEIGQQENQVVNSGCPAHNTDNTPNELSSSIFVAQELFLGTLHFTSLHFTSLKLASVRNIPRVITVVTLKLALVEMPLTCIFEGLV